MNAIDAVDEALSRGDYDRAGHLADMALASGVRDPLLYNVAAFRHSEAGRYQKALDLLHAGLELAPRDGNILYSIGFCLSRLDRDDAALAAFQSALDVRPGSAAPLQQAGMIMERRGEDEAAIGLYRQAMAADPAYEDPYGGLASIAAQQGDYAAARGYAAQALAIAPHQAAAHLAIAKADLDAEDHVAVIERLAPVIADPALFPPDRPAFLTLVGDALNALDRKADAFAAWTEGKRLAREVYADRDVAAGAAATLERIALFIEEARTLDPISPAAAPARDQTAPREHVFLVGFPRSGTTLLEQILATHPDVVTLEEKPLLGQAEDAFLLNLAGFRRLIDAPDALLDPFRDLYWQLLRERGVEPAGKVFIDKFPLNSLLIPLIARLFPDAKILFAERDPRDVVLSCFRRSFRMNQAMYQFVTLETSARFYDRVMTLAREWLRIFPIAHRPVRYESLVADFEGQCRAICAFIGLDWDDRVHDFAEAAKARAIHTPSAAQVRKGLYADGAGQWRRYQAQMAPVLPVLAPWVSTLGYPAEVAT